MDVPSPITNFIKSLPIRTRSPDLFPECSAQQPRTSLFSSCDSGYDSEATTPEKPSTPCGILDSGAYTLDGSGSDSLDCFTESGYTSSVARTPEQKNRGLSSSPTTASGRLQNRNVRCSLPASFYSASTPRSAQRHGSESISASLPASSPLLPLRSPDRFVHPRDSSCAAFPLAEKFRLTKPAEELTPVEKILRHGEASADAFSPSRPSYNPFSTYADERQAAQQAAGFPPQTRARTTLDTADLDDDLEVVVVNRPIRGSVWSIGTLPPMAGAVDNGRGTFIQTGTNAPFFTSEFVHIPIQGIENENKHAGRLAAALDFDRATRLLQCNIDSSVFKLRRPDNALKKNERAKTTTWSGTAWVNEGLKPKPQNLEERHEIRPLRILSAPSFRDDFYCSLLAYSPTSDKLAVGLGDLLYSWSETVGAVFFNGNNGGETWLTALAFSSTEGGRSILAFGRSNCVFGLMALSEANNARILVQEATPISCLSWRPTCTMRPSKNPRRPGVLVSTEDLLVGTDGGTVLYYVVEWPDKAQVAKDKWQGDITLVVRISVHEQQVCGIAWAPDGASFATGSNDNSCCFFYANDVLPRAFRPGGNGKPSEGQPRGSLSSEVADSLLRATLPDGSQVRERFASEQHVRRIYFGMENCRWEHGAAVKAIAFCPWQDGLVATGGGSNDRCVHFFHTTSGAALATIYVSAQVTSLMWSTTRREIAVTIGFAQPGHSVRIAVYSWPECKQVATISWEGSHRALFGISCSKGPHTYQQRMSRADDAHNKKDEYQANTMKEGCIAVASSDESIKFYELWPSDDMPVTGGVGMLGGSDILEDLEGIQKEGDIIR